jgi:hypothetical protein
MPFDAVAFAALVAEMDMSDKRVALTMIADSLSPTAPAKKAKKEKDPNAPKRKAAPGVLAWNAFVKHCKQTQPDLFTGTTKEAERLTICGGIKTRDIDAYNAWVAEFIKTLPPSSASSVASEVEEVIVVSDAESVAMPAASLPAPAKKLRGGKKAAAAAATAAPAPAPAPAPVVVVTTEEKPVKGKKAKATVAVAEVLPAVVAVAVEEPPKAKKLTKKEQAAAAAAAAPVSDVRAPSPHPMSLAAAGRPTATAMVQPVEEPFAITADYMQAQAAEVAAAVNNPANAARSAAAKEWFMSGGLHELALATAPRTLTPAQEHVLSEHAEVQRRLRAMDQYIAEEAAAAAAAVAAAAGIAAPVVPVEQLTKSRRGGKKHE